jgi:hypothetical protein
MASNSGDSSASHSHDLITAACAELFVNCQLNYGAISSQAPLQSSTELPTLNWLDCSTSLLYNHFAWTTSKTSFFCCCVYIHSCWSMFTEPSLRNGCFFIHPSQSNSCTHCLFRGLCLAAGLYGTICLELGYNIKFWCFFHHHTYQSRSFGQQ